MRKLLLVHILAFMVLTTSAQIYQFHGSWQYPARLNSFSKESSEITPLMHHNLQGFIIIYASKKKMI